MKTLRHSWFVILLSICCFQSGKSQCAIFPFFSANYDCVNNISVTDYTVNGAAMPFTFTVVNSSTNATITIQVATSNTGSFTAVPVGNYNIFITDANNCTAMASYQLVIPFSASSIAFTNTNVACFGGNNGVSFVNTSSSFLTPPYTYTWSTGSFASIATGLSAGVVYSVTLADSKGCKVTNTVSVTEPPLIVTTLSNTFVPCFGASISSGFISSGGTPGFTYSVNAVASASNIANNLFAGTQTVLTKDSKGCLVTNTVLITQVAQPVIAFTIIKPSCPGKSDGSASAVVSSAPAPYTYTWLPVISNISTLSNIPIGNYTLTVKDASACITKSVAVVLPAASMTVNATTNPENCSAVDGSATLNIAGGNFPYSFNTQPTIGAHASNIINSLTSGSYTTVIKDANNCVDTLIFNVGNLSTVIISISSSTPVLCYNQCTGGVQLSVQNAVPPITYSVSNTPTTNINVIGNLCAGFYTIKATDAIGCPATTTVNFPAPPIFSYSANAPASVCFSKPVLLQANASGGAGGFTYIWNPGNINGQAISLVPAGTTVYSLNVYDANGCTLAPYQLTVNVNAPISININSSNVGICPGTTAQVTPTITGGDGNYSYTWQPGNLNSGSIFVQNALIPQYTLSVNDGCGSPTAVQVIPINLFPVIMPHFIPGDTIGCEPFCTSFTNTTIKSTNAIWNYGDKPFELMGNTTKYCYQKAGVYNIKLTVNDSNNCKTSFTYSNVITVLASPKVDFKTNPDIITLNNAENVLIENLTANGGIYNWRINGVYMGASKDITYTFADTGCYFVRLIAQNQNNCVDTADKMICVIEGFNFYMPNCITADHNHLNDVLIPLGTGWTSKNYLYEIYNRWGNRIFKTSDNLQGWDGKVNDDQIDPNDIYYWRINITDNIDQIHELKGHVTVLR
ncbi:MAG: gliding motility-associated C-terminal domain-containing protein [Bacteroidetes bacterium]|nr:gliding motility-associated C-terminal domain-containing protein [Bacteroidota bacterium]